MDPSGSRRLGKYELLARLAKGGMAEILLARQHGVSGFSRLVVVKRILPHLADEAEFVQMFLEEARLAALISHPNVVQIFDVGHDQGSYYIAMEYIGGPSLSAVNRLNRERGRRLPFPVALEIGVQACEGLHAAHELCDEQGQHLGLVHRDVSPHNLMLTDGGVVKLVDFGIAKAQDTRIKTRTGKVKGKYPYLAPEQCLGESADRRSDIFSLGVTLYELVTGKRIFERSTDFMTQKAITEDPIPPPHSLNPELPERLGAIILHSMERDRERRIATAAELGRTLRRTLERASIHTAPELVARYLGGECAELLARRGDAVKKVLQVFASRPPPSGPGSLPSVAGFEDPSHADVSPAAGEDAPTTAHGRRGRGEERAPGAAAGGSRARPARRGRRTRWFWVTAVVVLLAAGGMGLWLGLGPSEPSGPPLLFGLPPSFPSEVAEAEMRPFLDYLARRVGQPTKLVVTRDYESLRSGLLAGVVHAAVLPHLQFLLARRESAALQVLATQSYEGSPTYQAYVVTRDDRGVESVADLRGKRFCYVDPGSASGFLIPRHFLRGRGLDPEKTFSATRFSGNHIAALKDLLAGQCDAAATSSSALLSASGLGVATSRVRVVAVAGQIPFDVVVASPDLQAALVEKLRRALLEFKPERDIGRKLIGPTLRVDGFLAPRLPDFQMIERAAREEKLIP